MRSPVPMSMTSGLSLINCCQCSCWSWSICGNLPVLNQQGIADDQAAIVAGIINLNLAVAVCTYDIRAVGIVFTEFHGS